MPLRVRENGVPNHISSSHHIAARLPARLLRVLSAHAGDGFDCGTQSQLQLYSFVNPYSGEAEA
jgi:hypothetical protein